MNKREEHEEHEYTNRNRTPDYVPIQQLPLRLPPPLPPRSYFTDRSMTTSLTGEELAAKYRKMDMHPSHEEFKRKADEAEAKRRLKRIEADAEFEKWQHTMHKAIGYPDGPPTVDLEKMDDYLYKSIAFIKGRTINREANGEPQTRTAAVQSIRDTSSNTNSQGRNHESSIRQDSDERLVSRSELPRPPGEIERNSQQITSSVRNAKHTASVSASSAKSNEIERPKATPKSKRVPRELKALQDPWFLGSNPSNSIAIDSDDDEEMTTPCSSPSKGQHPLPPLPSRDAHTQENRKESTAENEKEVDSDNSWQIQVDEKGHRPTKRRRRDGGGGKN